MVNIQMELQQSDFDLEQGRLSQGVPHPELQQQLDTVELLDVLLSECATACENFAG